MSGIDKETLLVHLSSTVVAVLLFRLQEIHSAYKFAVLELRLTYQV